MAAPALCSFPQLNETSVQACHFSSGGLKRSLNTARPRGPVVEGLLFLSDRAPLVSRPHGCAIHIFDLSLHGFEVCHNWPQITDVNTKAGDDVRTIREATTQALSWLPRLNALHPRLTAPLLRTRH